MSVIKSIKPIKVVTDRDETLLKEDEAVYIKNYRIGFGPNGNLTTGTGTGQGSGSNEGVSKPLPSTIEIPLLVLPAGFNLNVGSFGSDELNELYYLNYNSNGFHGVYRINLIDLAWEIVALAKELKFSPDPRYAIPDHVVSVHVVYHTDANGNKYIKEKHLKFVDGLNWQYWINVIACTKSDTFNAVTYPYWKTKQPHFDRNEYFEWPVRPPMQCPKASFIDHRDEDTGKFNDNINKSIQFATQFVLTDGRESAISPYSAPLFNVKSVCNESGENQPRCIQLIVDGGSPLVEKVRILRRFCDGDWDLIDTVNKYTSCDQNDPEVIGDEYWKRSKEFENNNYDPVFNTFKYQYCGDKERQLFSQDKANVFYNDIPLVSVAKTVAGDSELLMNNLYGYENLPCETMKNLGIEIVDKENGEQCAIPNRKITLYSMFARNAYYAQVAYNKGDDDKTVRIGGQTHLPFTGDVGLVEDEIDLFGLTLGEKIGPLMYLAGTPYYALGKMYFAYPDGTKKYIGTLDYSKQENKDLVKELYLAGGFPVFQYEFTVPAAKYIARMGRHNVSESANFAQTSTWVMGIVDSTHKSASTYPLTNGDLVDFAKEFEIDACNNDVDVWRNGKDIMYVFIPFDYKENLNHRWRFIEGYVTEDSTDHVGVELLRYGTNHGSEAYQRDGYYTDHNGHYFLFAARGDSKQSVVQFYGQLNCNPVAFLFQNKNLPDKERGYYPDENISVKDNNHGVFGDCNRILVKGKVTDCDGVRGLSGVAVTISRGGTTYTKSDGTFTLFVHNYFEGKRLDRIYYNASGECIFRGCACDCIDIDYYDDRVVPCVNCQPRIYPITFSKKYKLTNKISTSLKGGGRYAGGATVLDLAGRGTYIQRIGYKDVKTFIERGKIVSTQAEWRLLGPLKLKKEFKWITFSMTRNLNFKSFLQWVGDKIEFLNHDGLVVSNPALAVKVRITLQSLNDFNTLNTFATTTKYQFVEGDMLRIYDDGDGHMFDITNGFLDYLILGTNWNEATTASTGSSGGTGGVTTDGKSFIIPYDSKLDILKEKCGFWIELIRPKKETEIEQYCEACPTFPVINGEIAVFEGLGDDGVTPVYSYPTRGVINFWDTYYHARSFKITDCGGKNFTHPFESSAISDYWGDGCTSCGRKNIVNEDADQKWYPNDTIRSNEFLNNGTVNGLGTFLTDNRKSMKGQEYGAIIAAHSERNLVAIICENDWATCDFNMNIVKATQAGLYIQSFTDQLGDPHQKVGSKYGCLQEYKRTIIFAEDLMSWFDIKSPGLIISDYSGAANVSDKDNKSYFDLKTSFIAEFNAALGNNFAKDHFDIVCGYFASGSEYFVTFRPRRNLSTNIMSFINDEREIRIPFQETFVFDKNLKAWSHFAGFTPEAYGRLNSRLVSFAKGRPYLHEGETFNTFYGVKTQRVIHMAIGDQKKALWFQSLAVQSNNMMHFMDLGFTNEVNSFTVIPPAYWKFKKGVWYAEILADMNSYPPSEPEQQFRKMLIDGKEIHGKFFSFRLIGDLQRLDEYGEVGNILIKIAGIEQSAK